MSRLIALADAKSTTTDSRIGFQTEGNSNWPVWDRFITLDGKKAHYIGNVCGTCSFIFERHEGANDKVSPETISATLRSGLLNLDESISQAAMGVLPSGTYKAMLLSLIPRLIIPSQKGDYFFEEQVQLWGVDGFWGVPHYAKNEYYRTEALNIADRGRIFEFVVPMFPRRYLDEKTILSYRDALNLETSPTVLAVSILDVKQPATWEGEPEIAKHWCLAHYVLDGHHKLYAASQIGKPISILSFLAVERGVSSLDEIAQVIDVLAKA